MRVLENISPRTGRSAFLVLLVLLTIPPVFYVLPDVGLDPSWSNSLHLACIEGKTFGRDFVFTYGPLGYLQTRTLVNKLMLVSYDAFIVGSLLVIYRSLLPARLNWRAALTLLGLALLMKGTFAVGGAAVPFLILSFWIWHTYQNGKPLSVIATLLAIVPIFFGKVNYGLILLLLLPAASLGLLCLRGRRWCGLVLAVGAVLAIAVGSYYLRVDLVPYLRSGKELVSSYSEAMFTPLAFEAVGFELALLFFAGMAVVAYRHRRDWLTSSNIVLGLLLLGNCFLLYKNAFTRADAGHIWSFHQSLPLLLAIWCGAWKECRVLRTIFSCSLILPLILLVDDNPRFGPAQIARMLPFKYFLQLAASPMQLTSADMAMSLRERYLELIFDDDVAARLREGTVEVIPWETSLALANNLTLKQRPIVQSYCAFSPALDKTNADFFLGSDAPNWVLFACARETTIDDRVAGWDESATKRALLENYTLERELKLPLRLWPDDRPVLSSVFVLKHSPGARHHEEVASREVSLGLNEPIAVASDAITYLELEVKRSVLGRIKSAFFPPSPLKVTFQFANGKTKTYRATLPILRGGVLLSQTLEDAEEVRGWLSSSTAPQQLVTSVRFETRSHWSFQTPFRGRIKEYRLTKLER